MTFLGTTGSWNGKRTFSHQLLATEEWKDIADTNLTISCPRDVIDAVDDGGGVSQMTAVIKGSLYFAGTIEDLLDRAAKLRLISADQDNTKEHKEEEKEILHDE